MTHGQMFVALSMAVASLPLAAADYSLGAAPPGGPETKYCLRTEPITGTRIPVIECLTRDQWADGDVDVDEAWPKDGVKVIA